MGERATQTQTERLVVTNDGTRAFAILYRVFALLAFLIGAGCILGPVWISTHALFQTPADRANIVVGFIAGAYCVFLASHVWDLAGAFRWEFDAEGVSLESPRRPRRSLRWVDVDRVRWDGFGVKLRGQGDPVELRWNQLSPPPRDLAAQALLTSLRHDFEVPPPPQPLGAVLSRAIFFLLALIVSLAIGLRATILILTWYDPQRDGILGDPTVFAYTAAALLFAVVFIVLSPFLSWNARRRWTPRRG